MTGVLKGPTFKFLQEDKKSHSESLITLEYGIVYADSSMQKVVA
jgi:hypothetical protein